MTQPNPPSIVLDPIKYLERLPEFNGDKRDLYNFITLVDRVYPLLRQYDEMSQLVFSDLIKSRLRGKARETIEINFHAQSWTDVKKILMNNFGEKYSIEDLFDQMRAVSFKTNTIEFYNEIKDKLRNLNNKTSMIMGGNTGAGQIATNNMQSALNIFKEKIPEPMRTILACRNPSTLEDAMEILFKSGYAYYGNKTVKPGNNSYGTNNRLKIENNLNRQSSGHSNSSNRQTYQNSHTRTNNHQAPNQHYNPHYQQNPNNHRHFSNPNWRQHNSHYQQNPNNQNYQRNFNSPNIPNFHQNGQPNQRNNFLPVPEPMDVNLVHDSEEPYIPQEASFEQYFDQQEIQDTDSFETPQNFPLVASPENYHI